MISTFIRPDRRKLASARGQLALSSMRPGFGQPPGEERRERASMQVEVG
jgi:hypothetical protein